MYREFEMHGQVKILVTVAIVIFLRYSALREVEGTTTSPPGGPYHKLYINVPTSDSPAEHCARGLVFNSSLHNLTIYKEGNPMTEACNCVIYSGAHNNIGAWDVQVYTQNQQEQFDKLVFSMTSCDALHINVSQTFFVLKGYKTKESKFMEDLPIQIQILPQGLWSIHLQCSHDSFDKDTTWEFPPQTAAAGDPSCHVTTTHFGHVTESKAPVIKPSMTPLSPGLQTVLLAVIIPVVLIIILVIILLLCCWRRYRKRLSDDGTVDTDTIEVRTPKSKNTHLKLHKYENVPKPGIIEVEHEAPHVYDNVVTNNHSAQQPDGGGVDDGVLYAKVVKQITKGDSKALDDIRF